MIKTIFDVCVPREDVLSDTGIDAEFAADLSQVVQGKASVVFGDPKQFFINTYPTDGLRRLIENVCRRVSGVGGESASIFRLDTSYGGGKTHGLIALVHAVRDMQDVPNAKEFVDLSLLPKGNVRIAAFDGENADPANGRRMGEGPDPILAFTPWGEIAFELNGLVGFNRVAESDKSRIAPGAETLRELFGEEPTLILLDELGVYLRKVRDIRGGREQLTAFLTSLIKAVESAPNVALVYTLAVGKGDRSRDAYSSENEFIYEQMTEAESVSARKATLLNPTEEWEYPSVLRRRLFKPIDEKEVEAAVSIYQDLWRANGDDLDDRAMRPETVVRFRGSYPFHPDVLETFTEKAFTLANFQRIRGMLRLMGRTVKFLWEARPDDAFAIHLHHVDLGRREINDEIVTRLNLPQFVPVIANDVAGDAVKPALAQRLDKEYHDDLAPYATYVARTAFIHTLAFNEALQGVSVERLRYSILGPKTDINYMENARQKFVEGSAYLDDRPGVPMRFLAEPNINKLIQSEEQNIDALTVRENLDPTIDRIFSNGRTFEVVQFPGGPYDVADDIGNERPKLVIISYDAASIDEAIERAPSLVKNIFMQAGAEGKTTRTLRNNLVFLVADAFRIEEMRRLTRRRLALKQLTKTERVSELPVHQQVKIRELESTAEKDLCIAIQQCYRHLFYPSEARLKKESEYIAHTTLEDPSSANQPAKGQEQIERFMVGNGKLLTKDTASCNPAFVRDKTPLRNGKMSTAALRAQFRSNPTLPILGDDNIFISCVKLGLTNQAGGGCIRISGRGTHMRAWGSFSTDPNW